MDWLPTAPVAQYLDSVANARGAHLEARSATLEALKAELQSKVGNPQEHLDKARPHLQPRLRSGIYSPVQLNIASLIEKGSSAGCPMTAGTLRVLNPRDGLEHDAGLLAKHAYSVLAIRRQAGPDPNSDDRGTFVWVKLREPQGRHVRIYTNDGSGNIADVRGENREGEAVFWLELSDFTHNFDEVILGATPTALDPGKNADRGSDQSRVQGDQGQAVAPSHSEFDLMRRFMDLRQQITAGLKEADAARPSAGRIELAAILSKLKEPFDEYERLCREHQRALDTAYKGLLARYTVLCQLIS